MRGRSGWDGGKPGAQRQRSAGLALGRFHRCFRCATGIGIGLTLLHAYGADDAFERLAGIDFPRDQRVAFVERQKHRLVRKAVELRGEVWIERDSTMVMRILEPHLEERRIEAGQLVLIRPSLRASSDPDQTIANAASRSTTLDPSRGAHLALWAAVHVLAKDDRLRTRFTATWLHSESDETEWAVELLPRDEAARRQLRSIRLYGRADRLQRIRVEHGPSRWRDMRLAQ